MLLTKNPSTESATRALTAVCIVSSAFLVASCGSSASDRSTIPASTTASACDLEAALALSTTGGLLTGDVALELTLIGGQLQDATAQLSYSLDGGASWQSASVRSDEPATTRDDGARVQTVVWSTTDDVGYGTISNVALKASPFADCGAGKVAQLTDLVIENPEDRCRVTVDLPSSPMDGAVLIPYTLAHGASMRVDVQAFYSTDGGANYFPMHLLETDCDGDGVTNGTSKLMTSPFGVAHCFTWDSQETIVSDETVTMWLSCWVGSQIQDSVVLNSIELHNDPRPGASELLITELMFKSAYAAGSYMEVMNATNRDLNMAGLTVERWSAAQDPDSDAPRSSFTLDARQDIWIASGEYVVLSPSDASELAGCIEPDTTWPPTFTFHDDSTYRLRLGEETIGELSILDDAGWDIEESVAWGLAPDATADEAASIDVWCPQATLQTTCRDLYAEVGTPGAPNDPCP